jgi:hypothetical protein
MPIVKKKHAVYARLLIIIGRVGRIIKLQPQIVGQNKTKACGGNNLTCGLFQVEGGFDVSRSFLKALELWPFWLKLP